MPEIISQSFELAKEHGLGATGAAWIILFATAAWIVGKSGTGAVKFVRGLLDTSDSLRRAIAKELNETREAQRLADQRIREQDRAMAQQEERIHELTSRLDRMNREADDLLRELRRVKMERDDLRRELEAR